MESLRKMLTDNELRELKDVVRELRHEVSRLLGEVDRLTRVTNNQHRDIAQALERVHKIEDLMNRGA